MPSVKVKGMSCQHCVGSVTQALSNIEGISEVQVDLSSGQVTYREEKPVSADTIKAAISSIGFEVI